MSDQEGQSQKQLEGGRGFAAMPLERQREIASEGGHAAQARGVRPCLPFRGRRGSPVAVSESDNRQRRAGLRGRVPSPFFFGGGGD